MTPERLKTIAAELHEAGMTRGLQPRLRIEGILSAAITEATASLAAENAALKKQWNDLDNRNEQRHREWDKQMTDLRGRDSEIIAGLTAKASEARSDLKAAREEIAGLRESEKALYETVTAIATALGVEVWGYEELAPAVRVVLDERRPEVDWTRFVDLVSE